jgi:hypothetical protein
MSGACDGELEVREDNPAIRILEIVLAFALLGSLFLAGLRIYRRLPADQSGGAVATSAAQLPLTIVLRNDLLPVTSSVAVELYPIDVAALQNQFAAVPRPGKQFEDFLALRLKDVTPIAVVTDQRGRAVAQVSVGNWWLHARTSAAGGETLEWRLPLNVTPNQNTVELNRDNAYERAKKF